MQAGLALAAEADLQAVRRKSMALTQRYIETEASSIKSAARSR